MKKAVEYGKSFGHKDIWLYTDGNSEIIITIYNKLGFDLIAKVPDWFGQGSNRAVMRRRI